MRELHKAFSKATNDTRAEYMATMMANLKVGQEDLRHMEDLQIVVEERLIQVLGHFYKWDAILGRNLLIKANLFLSIDRIAEGKGSNFGGRYIINVFD